MPVSAIVRLVPETCEFYRCGFNFAPINAAVDFAMRFDPHLIGYLTVASLTNHPNQCVSSVNALHRP